VHSLLADCTRSSIISLDLVPTAWKVRFAKLLFYLAHSDHRHCLFVLVSECFGRLKQIVRRGSLFDHAFLLLELYVVHLKVETAIALPAHAS